MLPSSHIYRPQTKFAKVRFLHLSVSHSVHRGGIRGRAGGLGRAWAGGVHGGGMCGRGACVGVSVPPRHHEIRLVNARAVRILLECILVSHFLKDL